MCGFVWGKVKENENIQEDETICGFMWRKVKEKENKKMRKK